MAKDVEVAIVRPNFEIRVLGSIPLIQKFLDNIIVIIKLKVDGTLVSLHSAVTLHVHTRLSVRRDLLR
jgi:hypothetical protein